MARRLDDVDPDRSLLVRTHFGDEGAWASLVVDATAPYGPCGASAAFATVSDRHFEGMTAAELAEVPGSAFVVFAADAESMEGTERTLLVIDRGDDPGRCFRVVLGEASGPENNLRLGNLDFVDFAEAADTDGVLRSLQDMS